VWVPDSTESLEQAIEAGNLTETQSFDAKEALPEPQRNRSLAEDVAAMTVEGGVLIYGVGEDDDGRLTRKTPVGLQGVRERIDQIVQRPPSLVLSAGGYPRNRGSGAR
jgi:hypothetical protein